MPKTPKEVVLAAYHYLAEVTPPTQRISEVRVEEVKPMDDAIGKIWLVMLSYDNTGDFPFDKKREYKEFKVADDERGVLSMEQIKK